MVTAVLMSALCVGLLLLGGAPRVHAQSSGAVSQQLYIVPTENTTVALQAHVVRQQVTVEGNLVAVDVSASYRLRNPGQEDVIVGLSLLPGEGGGDRIQAITLSADGQFLPLDVGDTGGYRSQVTVAADSDLVVNLIYRSNLGDGVLPTVRYAPGWLIRWPGPVSTRLDMFLPETIVAASRVRVEPEDWSDPPTAAGQVGFRWLFDVSAAAPEYAVQFVQPGAWSELQSAAPARRGELFRQLAAVAPNPAARDRFYAQALGAYTAGLAGLATDDPAAATLHQGLAALYRTRVTTGENILAYAEAMVQEADAALAGLPEGDPRRGEVQQWQADGLQLMLRDAETRQDWQAAMQVVERFEQLPANTADPELLAAARRGIVVHQALQLLNQGNTEAAFALAGPALAGAELSAPPAATSLFQRWEITITASPVQFELVATAHPAPGQSAAATAAFANVVERWQAGSGAAANGLAAALTTPPEGQEGPSTLTLAAALPRDTAGLANLLPASGEWALLRTVLAGLAPRREATGRLWWQQTALSQPVDLRSVGQQWTGQAAGLARQAAELEAQGRAADIDAPETALQAQIRAANLRTTAAIWNELADSSWVQYRLRLDQPAGENGAAPTLRTWYLTVQSPSQMLRLNGQDLHAGIFLSIAGLVLFGLIGVAGVLWSLL